MAEHPRPALTHDSVHVWRARLDMDIGVRAEMAALLSAAEAERAASFRFERDRHGFVMARGILRSILGRYRGESPAEVLIGATWRGKPYLMADEHLRFNVSHSRTVALYAVACDRDVGIDVEDMAAEVDYAAIARRLFSRREKDGLDTLSESLRRQAFFECWTRKEALAKATGEGLGGITRLDSINPPSPFSLLTLDAGPGYAAAMCASEHVGTLSWREWDSGNRVATTAVAHEPLSSVSSTSSASSGRQTSRSGSQGSGRLYCKGEPSRREA